MKRLSETSPAFQFRYGKILDPEVAAFIRDLQSTLQGWKTDLVNAGNLRFISQNDRPTPEIGEVVLWKDADAGAGQPTHYLVVTDDNGVTVTFRSVETV